jgi:hypothetical protein
MEKPNLSGTWMLDRLRGRLEIPMPDSTVFVIEHREPEFHLDRTHVVGDAQDKFSIDLTTDGQAVHASHRGIDIEARAYWDGSVLVFDSTMATGSEKGSNVVRYELADRGNTFIAIEKVDFTGHQHINRWVFERTGIFRNPGG